MFAAGAGLLRVPLHDVVDLLQLVGQPLLAAELVLLQSQDQLLIVLHSIRVQLIECGVEVELVGVESRLLRQHRVHVLVRDDGHALDVLVISGHPVFVDRNVFGVQ